MKHLICILLAAVLLAACEHAPETTLKDKIKLPSGLEVECYQVSRGDTTHYIYVVEGRLTVTNNHQDGKTNVTRVTINGVDYAPVVEDQPK